MSLRKYEGEFLISPVPVHLGLNYCSHSCFYCFANLNKPGRRGGWESVNAYLKRRASGKPPTNLLDWYLSKGYPILCANDSDPFAKSNGTAFRQCLNALHDAGCRFVFQTRGGDGDIDLLSRLSYRTMVYVSLTSDQDETVKRNEPGAPLYRHRLDLIAACKSAGHHVVVGLNPLVSQWWSDFDGFVVRLLDLGVRHVWTGQLHLQYKQIANIPAGIKKRAESLISYARKKKKPDQAQLDHRLAALKLAGINVFEAGFSVDGHFWEPYFDLAGFPFFPTLEEWTDRMKAVAAANDQRPVAFSFEELCEWAEIGIPFRCSEFKDYLTGIGRSIRNAEGVVRAYGFRDVFSYLWRVLDYPSPLFAQCFTMVTDGSEVITDKGRDLLAYVGCNPDDQLTVELKDCVHYRDSKNRRTLTWQDQPMAAMELA